MDNRWVNLRPVTLAENCKNRRLQSNNKSGHIGVYWNKIEDKWHSQINANGGKKHLGYFTDIEDAIKVRKAAEIEYNYHPNHGQQRSL